MYHGQFRGSENLTWVTVRPAILVLQQAKFETHSEEVPFQSASTVMGKDRLTKHQFAALKSALLILQDPCGVRGSWVSVREITKLSCVGTEPKVFYSLQAYILTAKVPSSKG